MRHGYSRPAPADCLQRLAERRGRSSGRGANNAHFRDDIQPSFQHMCSFQTLVLRRTAGAEFFSPRAISANRVAASSCKEDFSDA